MEVTKSTTKFRFTDAEKETLTKAKDILKEIYSELSEDATICGYGCDDINLASYIMLDIVEKANSNPFSEVETETEHY